MFSAKIKQQVLSEYLQGTSPLLLMKKYSVKGSATIYQWLTQFEIFGIQGLEHCRRKTFYAYSFKIKVTKWRQEHHASYPVTTTYYRLKHSMIVWD